MPKDYGQTFRVERKGFVGVIAILPEAEELYDHEIQQAPPILLEPFQAEPASALVIDLNQIKFFSSAFLNFLLRCQMLVKKHGTKMALAAPSEQAREILHLSSLDTLWPIYPTAAEAILACT